MFRDDLGELTRRRQTYAWYPEDLWRWLIASQWHLIGNAEAIRGRTIETDDRIGSRLLAARLCRLVMEMAYLQQRRYRPYPKWFGAGIMPAITEFAVGVNDAIRPFPALNTSAFIKATVNAITDPALANLPRVGAIDQLTHSDDQLINFTTWPADLARTYRRMLG